MPARRRRSKRRQATGGIGKLQLKLGFLLTGEEASDRQWKLAWERHREELINEFRLQRPGKRPPPFWWFEAPESAPATGIRSLIWLVENGHVDRQEGDAILAEEQVMLDRGYDEFDPHGTLAGPRECADVIRVHRSKRSKRRRRRR